MRISPTRESHYNALRGRDGFRFWNEKLFVLKPKFSTNLDPFSFSSQKHLLLFQVSSVSLASEDPVDEDSVRNYYLGIADYFFTGKPRFFDPFGVFVLGKKYQKFHR